MDEWRLTWVHMWIGQIETFHPLIFYVSWLLLTIVTRAYTSYLFLTYRYGCLVPRYLLSIWSNLLLSLLLNQCPCCCACSSALCTPNFQHIFQIKKNCQHHGRVWGVYFGGFFRNSGIFRTEAIFIDWTWVGNSSWCDLYIKKTSLIRK